MAYIHEPCSFKKKANHCFRRFEKKPLFILRDDRKYGPPPVLLH